MRTHLRKGKIIRKGLNRSGKVLKKDMHNNVHVTKGALQSPHALSNGKGSKGGRSQLGRRGLATTEDTIQNTQKTQKQRLTGRETGSTIFGFTTREKKKSEKAGLELPSLALEETKKKGQREIEGVSAAATASRTRKWNRQQSLWASKVSRGVKKRPHESLFRY